MGKFMDETGVAKLWERAKTLVDPLYKHCWRRRSYVASIEIGELENRWFLCMGGSSTTGTIKYSDSVVVDPVTGAVSLAGPINTVKSSYSNYTDFDVIKGKYITTYAANNTIRDGELYFVSADTDITTARTTEYDVVANMRAVTGKITIGEWENVCSDSNDTYETGIVDGVETCYFGVPFDNAAFAPKIATGSYKGTGKYGSGNKTTITFDFVPQLVVVVGNNNVMWLVNGQTGAPTTAESGNMAHYSAVVSWSGNAVSWYFAESGALHMNISGTTYKYVAIG